MADQGIHTRSQRFEEFQRLVRELKEPGANPAQILTRMYNSFTTGFSKAEAENQSLRDAVCALTAELSSLKSQLNEVRAPLEEPLAARFIYTNLPGIPSDPPPPRAGTPLHCCERALRPNELPRPRVFRLVQTMRQPG
jgi:hypothetical protein